MRRLGDTVARLNASRKPLVQGEPTTSRLQSFAPGTDNPGGLDAFAYLPSKTSGAALVVVLHGCSQTAEAYDHGAGWSAHAEALGFALLFPQQARANNPGLCFNWFNSDDVARERGEAASIAAMISAMVSDNGLDPERVFITGLSAGGAMTAAMLASYPELFAAGAIIAGLPFGAATNMPQAFGAMQGAGLSDTVSAIRGVREASPEAQRWPQVTIIHGAADHTVAVANADALVSQWLGVHELDAAPDHDETTGRCRYRGWSNADGDVIVEDYRIEGMGHGTPLDIEVDPVETAGPFMLDVGFSSTLSLIESWKLAAAPARTPAPRPKVKSRAVTKAPKSPQASSPRTDGVKDVIESALRKAGLLA